MDNQYNEDGLEQPKNKPASGFLTGIRDLLGRFLEDLEPWLGNHLRVVF